MKSTLLVTSGIALVIGFNASMAGAQCAFQHPRRAKDLRMSFVQAFIPCDAQTCLGGWNEGGPCTSNADCPTLVPNQSAVCYTAGANSSTDIGLPSCKAPLTFNEATGSPSNGWLWGPSSSGLVSFTASANKVVDSVLNPPPNTADVIVKITLRDIENAAGRVYSTGRLIPARRTTFEDRAGGDMTVVDLSLPSFPVTVFGGNATIKTSANVILNQFGFKGVPGCTSLELLDLQLRDENDTLFGRPGIFLPDINPN
jgi:hypothetical protein